ncbi:NFACT family protein [Candidatus Woesearchaeota archaeon]|nr:NFACT family protein [Candidatus Woesearchaeota archaeon]
MIEISALDLHYLVQELKFLEGSKVDRITQPSKEEVAIQIYVTNKGKKTLKILPGALYLTDKKQETPETLFGFCAALRKYLSNSRLESISQIGSERIVEIIFKTKEEQYSFIAEFFSGGNAVLCRKDLTIIVPLKQVKSKEREIKAGVKYIHPKKEVDFFKLTLPKLKSMVKKSEQTISRVLAVDVGLGGNYAREVCISAGVDEKTKALGEEKIKKIFDSLNTVLHRKKEGKMSFNSEIEMAAESQREKPRTKYQKEMERLQKIITKQESKIREIRESSEENQRKGESIYENYQLINQIIEEIRKARKKHSWKEIKARLKGHKMIKDVNEKTGEIIIELG